MEADIMHAMVGDRVHIHGRTVGTKDRFGEIIEVRGNDGAPPYMVRYPDGHESLFFPGSDCIVEQQESSADA
jgi:hypothetical protein